jgi:glycosyltransferase involved in cell wall biosynthesis
VETEYIESLGLESNKYIIAVARFVPEKGFDDLIEAYKLLKTEYKLVLVGDADHESEYSRALKQKAKENAVVLTGFIKGEKLNEIFTNAALFVIPSYHEGLPIALLEALSYNLRVVVSNILANMEVEIDKECYFKVGDVNELASRITQIITSTKNIDYSKLLVEKYNSSKIANQTLNVYKKILIS